jgi:hypothetical protein
MRKSVIRITKRRVLPDKNLFIPIVGNPAAARVKFSSVFGLVCYPAKEGKTNGLVIPSKLRARFESKLLSRRTAL